MPEKPHTSLSAKQQEMLEHIQHAKQQGQSLSHYAREHGLNQKALYNYHWVLRKKGLLESTTGTPSFVKVTKTKKPAFATSVTIYFPNGIQLQVNDHTALPMLLQQVQSL